VLVHMPGTVLDVTGLVFVALPLDLNLSGHGLLTCCTQFPYTTLIHWVVGVALWLAAMYRSNNWIERGARFRERVQPTTVLRQKHERIEESISESNG